VNKIQATITQIQNVENLHVVKFDFEGISLEMMSLDLSSAIKIGTRVHLSIKPTHLALAKEFSGVVSYSNQIKAKVVECENGKLLSAITLLVKNTMLESIITLDSSLRMNLQVDDEITIFIKASELSIFEVLDGDYLC